MANHKYVFALAALLLGCSSADSDGAPADTAGDGSLLGNGDEAADPSATAATCGGKWKEGVKTTGGIPDLGEASGLASSKDHAGWGWVIRDSGRPSSVYAIKANSNGIFTVKEHKVAGATNKDWEDVVYGEENGKGVLYVLDTAAKLVYKLAEPDPNGSADATVLAKYSYSFPDSASGTCGPTNNAESMFLFPPVTGKLHIVRKKSSPAGVYVLDNPSASATTALKKVGELDNAACISVASISHDGLFMVTAAHESTRVRKGTGSLQSLLSGPIVFESKTSAGDSVEGGDFFPWGSCAITLVAEGKNTFVFNPAP
ncbi:hypothetical protein LZC95_53150 [Pendulispora brunnea]|uniref:Uncharacterized protein n=1 Tax=Pendulispora brunnea TaxID=2905690 RepID=A0ABZ2K8Z0_9BACT